MRGFALILVAVALLCASGACASAEGGSGPLAWWRFDPTRFNGDGGAGAKARAAAEAGLRIASSGGLIGDDETVQLVQALLAASAVGGVPHSLVIEELGLTHDADGNVRLERVSAVLNLETRAQHAELLRTIQSILVDSAQEGEGAATQRPLELPGGRTGVAFTREGWSEAREVSWSSHEGGFTVGLGRGALERWFAAGEEERGGASGAIAEHRAALGGRAPEDRFFEMYVDLNALRHALEPIGEEDRITPVLAAFHLANARDVMLHGTWVDSDVDGAGAATGAMLAFDATWSVRSERPGIVHRLHATAEAWPEGFVLPRPPSPPARYAIVAEVNPAEVIREGIDLYAGTLPKERRREFGLARGRWEREHGAEMRRIVQSLERRIMLSDHPRPVVAAPGATTVFLPLSAGVDRARFEGDVRGVLAPFADLVAWDEDERAWSIYLDKGHIARIATWGLAEVGGEAASRNPRAGHPPRLVLIGGFDLTLGEGAPSALLRANRAWIAGVMEQRSP